MRPAGEVADKGVFHVSLVGFIAEAEEIEVVRVLEDFGGEASQRRREALVKVGDGLTLAEVELVLDLDGERVAWPGMLAGLLDRPFTQGGVVDLGEGVTMWNQGNWSDSGGLVAATSRDTHSRPRTSQPPAAGEVN